MFKLEADRICRIRAATDDELPMPVDPDGFLDTAVAVMSTGASARPGDLLTPLAAAQAHALVMLGEPGIGKTTALRAIADEIRGQAGELAWFNGSDLDAEAFAEEVGAVLRRLPPAGLPASRSSKRKAKLTVVIDGLDESPMVRRLPQRLSTMVSNRDTSALTVLIGCRTADLPPSLSEVLAAAFEPFLLVDLAPLRRADAVALASSAGVDGELLVGSAVQSGAGSLAAIPLTLQLLVRTFVETGNLEQGAGWLFANGVTQLLAEKNQEHDRRSTLEQRTAIAERIAAVLLLSGRRTMYLGPDLAIRPKTDLRASVVSDGDELTPSGPFRLTLDLVRDTLASQLFSSRGLSRRAFGHASHATFLAARYLHRRQLPRRQLEGLLLVAGPDGSRTVPIPLREMAAWLASIDLDTGHWLAEADPQSLIGHDAYLESDDLRSVVAASLLERAEEFELGERAWTHRLRLPHPGLADQVLAVLDLHDVEPEAWPDFARCRLALRLAIHAASPELTARLFEIVESDGWNAHMRSMAAGAVLAGDEGAAVPRLREALRSLRDPEYARVADPDDELKGRLLDALWPRHVSTEDILPLLVARRRTSVVGSYWMFLRNFASRLKDDEMEPVMAWATSAAFEAPRWDGSSQDEDDEIDLDEAPVGLLDVTLIQALLDRVLASEQFEWGLDHAAALMWRQFERQERPELPTPLDEVGSKDPELVAQKRRLVADALVRFGASHGGFGAADAFKVVGHWRANYRWEFGDNTNEALQPRSRLLDVADFAWALDRAVDLDVAGNRAAALGMAEVAGLLFDRSDIGAIEAASRQEGTVNWQTLAVYFDAIPIDGETAQRLRRWHEFAQRSEAEEGDPAQAAMLRDELLQLFERVMHGDIDKFWVLAWNLQFPPGTTRGPLRRDDRLLDFPGISVLGSDALTRLLVAARAFLLAEHDQSDNWLGTDRFDKRAWAGYLALVLLDECGKLDSIPATKLASWAGAVLWFHTFPSISGSIDRKVRLLGKVASAAPVRLARLLPLYIEGELGRGSTPHEVGRVVPSDPAVLAVWVRLTQDLTESLLAPPTTASASDHLGGLMRSLPDGDGRAAAMWTWKTLLGNLAHADGAAAEQLVIRVLNGENDDRVHALAAAGVRVLLGAGPHAWHRLFPLFSQDRKLGQAIALAIAYGDPDVQLTANLDERELAGLYRWLATLFPPAEDRELLGAHFVSPDEQVRRLRDSALTTIANRGTEESVQLLAELHDEFPLRPVVTSNLIRARMALFATAWVAPSPEDVQALLADARRRLVRSSGELGELVQETLAMIGDDMVHVGELLWDRVPPGGEGMEQKWRPKPEAALASFITHDLQLRLQGRGLAVHREVLIKATNAFAAGDKPDLIVEANVPADALSHTMPERFRVVIEVKCPWNDGVLTDQRDQLASRYLPEAHTGTGLFVVGWYPMELWTAHDYRLSRLKVQTAEELEEVLSAQAEELSAVGVSVKAVILTVPRPARSGEIHRL